MSWLGRRSGRGPRHFPRGDQGAAAVEFAFALFLLTIPILNVVDLSFYAFSWMQTQNAAQMGAQAAYSNCNNQNDLPAATTCYQSNSANNLTLYDVVAQGVQESALNNTVSISGNTVVDGYFCSTTAVNFQCEPTPGFGKWVKQALAGTLPRYEPPPAKSGPQARSR